MEAVQPVIPAAAEPAAPPVVVPIQQPLSTTAADNLAPVFETIAKQRSEGAEPPAPPAAAEPPVVVPSAAAEPKAGDEAAWKKMPLADILKELNITDAKSIKMVEHLQNKGDIADYLKVFNTDFTAMPEQDLLAMKINEDYADYTEEERNDLLQTKLDSYKLDPDLYTEDEVRRAKIALKADLKDFRSKKISEQAELITKAPASASTQVDNAEITKQYVEALAKHPDYINLEKTGTVKVGNGESAFNMNVDKAKVMAYLADDEAYANTYLDADGKTDFSKQLRVAAYAVDPDAYDAELLKQAGKASKISLVNELGNEGPGAAQAADQTELTDAQRLVLHIHNQQRG